jgi:hypothetical protein
VISYAETPRFVRKTTTFPRHEVFEVVVTGTRSLYIFIYFSFKLKTKRPEIITFNLQNYQFPKYIQ